MRTLFCSALFAAPLLLAADRPLDRVALQVEEGQSCTRTIELKSTLELVEQSQLFDGEEQPGSGEMEREETRELVVVVSDEVLAADEGRATRVSRSYDELEESTQSYMSHPMMPEAMENEMEAESELTERTVVFAEDEDGEMIATFEGDDDADDPMLRGLEQDMDLSAFLPEGEVSEGDTWSVDAMALDALLSPGGALKLVPEGMDASVFIEMEAEQEPEYDGEIEVEYSGLREVDGAELAVVSVSIDVSLEVDRTEMLNNMQAEGDVPEGMVLPEFDVAEERNTWEGDGEILWDLENGRLHSASFELDLEQENYQEMSIEFGGSGHEIESSETMAGSFELTISVE